LFFSCSTLNVIKKNKENVKVVILEPPIVEKKSFTPNIKSDNKIKIDTDIYDIKPEEPDDEILAPEKNTNKQSTNKKNQVDNNNKSKSNSNNKNNNTNQNNNQTIDLATVNLEKFKVDEKEVKEIQVGENQKFSISLSDSGWIIRKLYPNLIKVLKRDNRNTNTIFQFQSTVACNVSIMFLRYNAPTNSIWRQVYNINVMPKLFNEVKDNIEEKSSYADSNDYMRDEGIVFDDGKNEIKMTPEKKEKNKKSKKDMDYKLDIANQQYTEKKYDEAGAIYRDLVNAGEGSPEIYFKLGMIEKIKNNLDKSNEYFKKVLEEKDELFYSDALLELMKNLQAGKKYLEAIDTYYKYTYGRSPNTRYQEELNLMLADTYYSMKDYKNAGNEYRRFIKLYPDSFYIDKALFYLANALENFKNNPDFKEAYRLYKIIVDDYPESVYYNKSKERILFLERHYLKIN
jgi:TolA-binding protein